VVPLHPAAYVRDIADRRLLMATAAQRGWPEPVVYAVRAGRAGGRAAALGRLRAAVSAGRHDALLMPLPGVLGDAGQFMRLLASCTRMGVVVSFVPMADPGHAVRAADGAGGSAGGARAPSPRRATWSG